MIDLEPCPRCDSADTSEITYGYPVDDEEYLRLAAARNFFWRFYCEIQ